MVDRWDGETIILGDFNKVRSEHEGFGTIFNIQGVNAFNSFIALTGFIDLPLGGYSFTWAHKSATKMNIDRKLDQGRHNEEIFSQRSTFLKDLHDIDSIESLEIAHKAKVRWSIEGDENSKYFDGVLNNKRSQLSIRGILDKGDWIDDPSIVKMKFLEHFSNHFSKPDSNRLKPEFPFPNQISHVQVSDLEREVSYNEIKSAVWECGTNKSPGLDDFTFEFFRKFWSIIDKDVVAAVRVFFSAVMSACLFKGISLNESLTLSHLFYADDVVFVGEWDVSIIQTLVHVLKCFFLASGLKINLHKSKLMGIGINQRDVEKAARLIRCSTFSTPFNYLGVKVGDDMSKSKSWDEVTSKLSSRLSKWKFNTLSIGGRLTIFESVLTSIPLYHKSIFKVPIGVLNKMESIHINFFNGVEGMIFVLLKTKILTTWLSCEKRWVIEKTPNEVALEVQFPRVYALESQKDISVVDKKKDITLDLSFRRSPRGRDEEVSLGEFSIKSVQIYIDDFLLPTEPVQTRSVKVVPIKVNIMAWRVWLDNLPTRFNLSSRGLEILSLSCPL
ncbi:hypothetical protein Tco_0307935 [Tanacetum coccineum]